MKTVMAAALVAWALAQTAGQQSATPAAISGVVVDAGTGQPLAGAVVTLATSQTVQTVTGFIQIGAPVRVPRQVTDELGRFVFSEVAGGSSVVVQASKAGYFPG